MKNKTFNRSSLVARGRHYQKFEDFGNQNTQDVSLAVILGDQMAKYVHSGQIFMPQKRPFTSQVSKNKKNPEEKHDNCRKNRPFSQSSIRNRSSITMNVLSLKKIDIEWTQHRNTKEGQINSSIHSINQHSSMSLRSRQKTEKSWINQFKIIPFSMISSPPHQSLQKKHKKRQNFMSVQLIPSKSKFYNRMFQLDNPNRGFNIKGMFKYPVDANFNLNKSHLGA